MKAGGEKEQTGPDPALGACPAPVGFVALSRWFWFQTLFLLLAPCLLPGLSQTHSIPILHLSAWKPAVSNALGLLLAQEGSDT